jgi:hypothetical protein
MPKGHDMLVGLGESQKQYITPLTTILLDSQVAYITPVPTYQVTDLSTDLQNSTEEQEFGTNQLLMFSQIMKLKKRVSWNISTIF